MASHSCKKSKLVPFKSRAKKPYLYFYHEIVIFVFLTFFLVLSERNEIKIILEKKSPTYISMSISFFSHFLPFFNLFFWGGGGKYKYTEKTGKWYIYKCFLQLSWRKISRKWSSLKLLWNKRRITCNEANSIFCSYGSGVYPTEPFKIHRSIYWNLCNFPVLLGSLLWSTLKVLANLWFSLPCTAVLTI